MSTTAPQRLKIVYNSVTFGTGNEDTYRILDGTFEYTADRLVGTLSFNIVVFATTYAELITRTTALQNTMRDRRKNLTVEINGSSWYSFAATGSIHKNLYARFTQVKSALFTGKTQEYHIEIDIDLPPPSGTNGRTEKSVILRYKPNRERILTMTNQYNATSERTAKANYEADTAYWTSVQVLFAGESVTWKLVSEEISSEDAINSVQFDVTQVWEELIGKIRIDYGAFQMGPTGAYRILDGWSLNRVRSNRGTITFKVRVYGDTASATSSACNALEEAMVERNVVLALYYDGVQQREFTGANIYVNAIGQSTGEEGEWFGANTRDYRVSVEVDMPPKNSNGITEKDVRLSYGPQRRIRIEITAQYNSVSGSSATDLMAAGFNTYCLAILESLGGDSDIFKLLDESYNVVPEYDNVLEVRRTYEEILFGDTSATAIVNDGDIIGLVISVDIGRNYPGDFQASSNPLLPNPISGTVKRLLDIRTTASMSILKTADIQETYETKIRDFLVGYTKDISRSVLIALVGESTVYDPTNSSLSCTLQFKGAVDGAGQVISSKMETTIRLTDGKLLVGAWDRTKFGYFEIDTKAIRERVISQEMETVLGAPEPPLREPLPRGSGPRWVRKGTEDRHSSIKLGNPDNGAEGFDVVTLVSSYTQNYITDPVTTTYTPSGLGA